MVAEGLAGRPTDFFVMRTDPSSDRTVGVLAVLRLLRRLCAWFSLCVLALVFLFAFSVVFIPGLLVNALVVRPFRQHHAVVARPGPGA
jgi:hypothetical protein